MKKPRKPPAPSATEPGRRSPGVGLLLGALDKAPSKPITVQTAPYIPPPTKPPDPV